MNNANFIKAFILLVFLGIQYPLYAQKIPVKGIVKFDDGTLAPGASVVEKGTTNGVITDSEGNFNISLSNNATIAVSFVGYTTKEIPIENQTFLSIVLETATLSMEEVVVTGYSTQRKADLTGAVSVVKIAEVAEINSGNIMHSLKGRVSGMQVTSNGSPDGGSTVRIRGIGTLGDGIKNDPLYIIDGVPSKRSMNELASTDIESIQVLKDASSASIYGSRAANGVIIITTKKGKTGETRVDFRASTTIQNYSKSLKLLNTHERGYVQWRAALNDGVDPDFGVYKFKWHNEHGIDILDEVILPEYLDAAKTMKPADTDWQKEIGRTGIIQNYNMTLTSGSEKSHSLFSIDYFNNDGTVRGTNFNRITARLNTDYTLIKDYLKIGENLSVSKVRKSLLDAGGLLNQTHEIWSIIPVHTEDGIGWGGPVAGMSDRQNPMRIIEDNKQNHEDYVRLFGDIHLDFEPIKNLHFRSKLGLDYTGYWQRNMQLKYVSGFMSDNVNRVNNSANKGGNWILSNTLSYTFDIGKNNFDVLAGQEMIKYNYEEFSAGANNFAREDEDYMYLNVGTSDKRVGGSATSYALLSYFGKINYNYDNRYLLSATLRYDGSSRFGKNNRWGTFPAFSVGWRLSQEQFFRDALPFVSDLKLRYGWGKTGNQEIGDYSTYGLYQALYGSNPTNDPDNGTAYNISGNGSTLESGYRRTQMPNPNIKWEGTTQNNAGIDIGFLNQKITASFDYFYKKTEDILIKPPFIATIGEGGDRWFNGASMENTGFEIGVVYTDRIGDFDFAIAANASQYKNKITKLPDDVIGAYAGNGNDQTILGRPLSSMYGHQADGLFRTQEEVDAHVKQTGKGLGRIRYVNAKTKSGDEEEEMINNDDRVWLGNQDPKLLYGINISVGWKNFDFSMFWNGVAGKKVDNGVKRYTDFVGFFGGHNYGRRTLDAWSPQNPGSDIPALSLGDNNVEEKFSSYFIEKASYLKLANLEIGYTLPNPGNQNILKNVRIYFSGQNILTIKSSEFTGIDPELPNLAYPIPFSLTFGINLTF